LNAASLVLLVTHVTTIALSASQVEAARLAGGEKTVLWYAFRHALPPALLAAGLAAVLTFTDAGPGQIFGLRTASSEMLVSFAAFNDFVQAGRQAVVLAVCVLVVVLPLGYFAGPRLGSAILARQLHGVHPQHHR